MLCARIQRTETHIADAQAHAHAHAHALTYSNFHKVLYGCVAFGIWLALESVTRCIFAHAHKIYLFKIHIIIW